MKIRNDFLDIESGSSMPEPPDDNKVYGRSLETGETVGEWSEISAENVEVEYFPEIKQRYIFSDYEPLDNNRGLIDKATGEIEENLWQYVEFEFETYDWEKDDGSNIKDQFAVFSVDTEDEPTHVNSSVRLHIAEYYYDEELDDYRIFAAGYKDVLFSGNDIGNTFTLFDKLNHLGKPDHGVWVFFQVRDESIDYTNFEYDNNEIVDEGRFYFFGGDFIENQDLLFYYDTNSNEGIVQPSFFDGTHEFNSVDDFFDVAEVGFYPYMLFPLDIGNDINAMIRFGFKNDEHDGEEVDTFVFKEFYDDISEDWISEYQGYTKIRLGDEFHSSEFGSLNGGEQYLVVISTYNKEYNYLFDYKIDNNMFYFNYYYPLYVYGAETNEFIKSFSYLPENSTAEKHFEAIGENIRETAIVWRQSVDDLYTNYGYVIPDNFADEGSLQYTGEDADRVVEIEYINDFGRNSDTIAYIEFETINGYLPDIWVRDDDWNFVEKISIPPNTKKFPVRFNRLEVFENVFIYIQVGTSEGFNIEDDLFINIYWKYPITIQEKKLYEEITDPVNALREQGLIWIKRYDSDQYEEYSVQSAFSELFSRTETPAYYTGTIGATDYLYIGGYYLLSDIIERMSSNLLWLFLRSKNPITSGGTDSAYTLSDTFINNTSRRTVGVRVCVKFHNTNAPNATLNVSNTGAAEIRFRSDTPIAAGQIPQNSVLELVWDGTYWIILSLHGNENAITELHQGANVTISGTGNARTISVTGISLPDKFSSTQNGSGSIGSSFSGMTLSMLTGINTQASPSVKDVVVFSNGYQAEITAISAPTWSGVIISTPVATAWGAISGTLTNQTDLNSALSGKQSTITGAATSITSSNLTSSRLLTSDVAGKVSVNPNSISANRLVRTGSTANQFQELDQITANRALISDANGFPTHSSVYGTELGYLAGVSSPIQAQINTKQSTIVGGASTIASSNLAANMALVSNNSGKVATSLATSFELDYLNGATGNIQDQLDILANKKTLHTTVLNGLSGLTANQLDSRWLGYEVILSANATLSNASTSLGSSNWANRQELLFVISGGSSVRTITIPSGASYLTEGGIRTVTVPANQIIEMSVLRINSSTWRFVVSQPFF